MATSFAIYDTETTGTNTFFDQVLQYAALHADENLAVLDEFEIRCRPSPHVIPHPMALLVTHVDPYEAEAREHSQFEMARIIHRTMSAWEPEIFVGHNSIGFDEQITRSMFFQNLLDPYVTTSNGSRRADTLVMIRAMGVLAPGLVPRLFKADGKETHKLELLAPLFGFDQHDAHDAMGDIRAALHIMRRLRDMAPAAWDRLIGLADPQAARAAMTQDCGAVLATHFGRPRVHPLVFVTANPENPKELCFVDLDRDPAPLLDLSPEALKEKLSTDRTLRRAKMNTQPIGMSFEDPAAERLLAMRGGLRSDDDPEPADAATMAARRRMVQEHPTFATNLAAAFRLRKAAFAPNLHPEQKIYEGFPSWKDKERLRSFHAATDWGSRYRIALDLEDKRLRSFAFRLVLEHAPQLLPESTRTGALANVAARVRGDDPNAPWTTLAVADADLAAVIADLEVADPLGRLPAARRIADWLASRRRALAPAPASISMASTPAPSRDLCAA